MRDGFHPIRVVSPDRAERLDVLGAPMIVQADGVGLPLFLAEHMIAPGYLVPLHIHDDEDELFYVLAGALTLLTDAGEVQAGPGACIHLPRGSRHGYRNDSGGEVRLLVICLPGVQALGLFRQIDRTAKATGSAPPPPVLVSLCAAHGVRMG